MAALKLTYDVDENGRRASGVSPRMGVELNEAWEMYSVGSGEWVRVVVTKIEAGEVTLRYEGVLEFITVDFADMENPERFWPV